MKHTAKAQYDSMEAARQRLLELLCYEKHRQQYHTRTDMAAAMIRHLESLEGFEDAAYAFDNCLLCKQVVDAVEDNKKEWVSALESTRLVLWNNDWTHLSVFAKHLRQQSPQSFRKHRYQKQNGCCQRRTNNIMVKIPLLFVSSGSKERPTRIFVKDLRLFGKFIVAFFE